MKQIDNNPFLLQYSFNIQNFISFLLNPIVLVMEKTCYIEKSLNLQKYFQCLLTINYLMNHFD